MGKRINIRIFFTLMLIVVVHLGALSRLKFSPYPELFIYPYLTNIGLVPYLQIFDQHFPGLLFFPINLGTLGVTSPENAKMLFMSLIAITQILIYVVTFKFTRSKLAALVACLLYFLWQPLLEGATFWIDSFMPIMLLPSAYFYASAVNNDSKLSPAIYSGVIIGLALLFKQVLLPLILLLFLLLLALRGGKRAILFLFSSLVPIIFMFGYIIRLGAWRDFYYWTVEFNLGTFAEMGRKHASFAQAARALPVFLLSFLSIFKLKTEVYVSLAYMLGALVFAYARFDYVHLQPALPFAAILGAVVLSKGKKLRKDLIYFFIIFSSLVLAPFYRHAVGRSVLFFDEQEDTLVEAVAEYSKSGDSIFAMGTTPHIYALTSTRPPGDVFVFHFPWFMVEAEDKILRGIHSSPPKVVLRDQTATTAGQLLVAYMPNINTYINKNYVIVNKVGTIEILIPR